MVQIKCHFSQGDVMSYCKRQHCSMTLNISEEHTTVGVEKLTFAAAECASSEDQNIKTTCKLVRFVVLLKNEVSLLRIVIYHLLIDQNPMSIILLKALYMKSNSYSFLGLRIQQLKKASTDLWQLHSVTVLEVTLCSCSGLAWGIVARWTGSQVRPYPAVEATGFRGFRIDTNKDMSQYMYMYMYTYVYVQVHAYVYSYVYVYVYVYCMYMYRYVCMCIYIYTYRM